MNFSSLFSQLFGQAAEHLPIDDPEMAQAVRILSKVQMHLQTNWRHAQRMGVHCELQVRGAHGDMLRCVEPMANTCVACRKPVCLYHSAAVPETGDLICFGCIGLAQQACAQNRTGRAPNDYGQPGNAPRGGASSGNGNARASAQEDEEKLRRKYMKRLKLTGEPTESEIKTAFKREAAKAHPDRVPPERRQKAHEKFVGLGEARDWLLANMKRKAA